MTANHEWRLKVPSGAIMTYVPIILMVIASLAVSAWVIIGSGSGNTPEDMMGKPGSLAEYAPLLRYGTVVILFGFFWLFWSHKTATLKIEAGYLILQKKFGRRALPLERIRPTCSRLYGRRGEDSPIGVVCSLTGKPSEKGFRVFGYGAECPAGMVESDNLYGKKYDIVFMEPAEFNDFLNTLQRM